MFKDGQQPSREQESQKLSTKELAKKAEPLVKAYSEISKAKHISEATGQEATAQRLAEINPNFKRNLQDGRAGWDTAEQMITNPNSQYLTASQRLTPEQIAELKALLHDTAAKKYSEEKEEKQLPENVEQQALEMLKTRREYCQAHKEQEEEIKARKNKIAAHVDKVLISLKKISGQHYYGKVNAFGVKPHKPGESNLYENWIAMIKEGKYPAEFLNNPSVQGELDDESIAQLQSLGDLKDELNDLDLALLYFSIEKEHTESVLNKLATEGTVFSK